MKTEVLIQNLNVSIFVKDRKETQDDALIRDFLDDIIVSLDMTVLIPPIGVKVPVLNYIDHRGNKIRPDDQGLSHILGIAESHIATHTWPDYKLVYMEISSCKPFSIDKVMETIKKYFPENEKIDFFDNTRIIHTVNE